MNFIIYSKTTGRIDQTGYTLWEAPAASPEYIAAQKRVSDLSKALQKEEIQVQSLTALIETEREGVEYSLEEAQRESYQQEVERISEELSTAQFSLDELAAIKTENYNEAKQGFLDSMCGEEQSAIEGTADASIEMIQVSDKTVIGREPDPIPFGNINRSRRDSLLNLSDWTQVPDSPLSNTARESWRLYRVALRDLSDTVQTFETAELIYSDIPERPE
jgi:type I site-specific restriction endonuclease